MTDDALGPVDTGPETDALTEQREDTRPIEAKPSREDAVRQAVEKTLGKEAEKPPEKEDKPEAKPDSKAQKAEGKPEVEAADKPEKTRQPDGKFASSDPKEEPKKPTAFKDAPQRFDDAAKADWDSVPESVRGAIHRAQKEMGDGIEKYRGDAEAYEPLRQYDALAKQNGGSLEQSLQRVIAIEQAFARSPMEGMQRIADHFRFDLRQFAAYVAQQTPQQANDARTRMQMAELQRQNEQLAQHVQRTEQQRQQDVQRSVAQTEWGAFSASHPRAAELEPVMAEFIQKYPATAGVSVRERLEDAYAFAVAKHPNAAHTGDPEALAQTQPRQPNPAGRKSISGGGKGEGKSSPRNLSRDDAIREGMRAAGLL